MRVLGIETSCDETGIAVYDSKLGLLAHHIFSQETHSQYGGVVPELASRCHVQKTIPMIKAMLTKEGLCEKSIQGIGYTAGPGLIGALMVGAMVWQSLAMTWDIPAIGIHHLEGHLLAPMLESNPPEYPFLALLVSGGHTQLIEVQKPGQYRIIGNSLDDAAGEAFDKTAKLLGLPYPGGPLLAKLATTGNRQAFNFPRPLIKDGLDFSFSGLKTAVANTLARYPDPLSRPVNDLAASFETAVIDTLVTKSLRALSLTKLTRLVVAGGVGANQYLRETLSYQAQKQSFQVFYPRPEFCTDNGAMIAYCACLRLSKGEKAEFPRLRARWPLDELNSV